MKRWIAATGTLLLALGLFCRGDAAAQNRTAGSEFIGPAMSLDEARAAPGGPQLTVVTPEGNIAHVFPTYETAKEFFRANPLAGSGPLTYHGGPIMQSLTIHRIFWIPPSLQNGAPGGLTNTYINTTSGLTVDYPGHGIDNNNTQYFQKKVNVVTFVQNAGVAPVGVKDFSPYPASGCKDPVTPGNCLSDAQLRAEIVKIMTQQHWTAGLGTIFVLYTDQGEGSCTSANSCAYTQYCAYHSAFGSTAAPIIYATIPFNTPAFCTAPGTPSPNHDPAADAAASSTSHEISEAITDPLFNAWFGTAGAGSEIGDLCAFKYGPATWDSGFANQSWNGHFYELQMEYDNHARGCTQIGP